MEDYESIDLLLSTVKADRRTLLDPSYNKSAVHSGEHLAEQMRTIGTSRCTHMFFGER